MDKFEYKIIKINNIFSKIEKELNNYGADGWEIYSQQGPTTEYIDDINSITGSVGKISNTFYIFWMKRMHKVGYY